MGNCASVLITVNFASQLVISYPEWTARTYDSFHPNSVHDLQFHELQNYSSIHFDGPLLCDTTVGANHFDVYLFFPSKLILTQHRCIKSSFNQVSALSSLIFCELTQTVWLSC